MSSLSISYQSAAKEHKRAPMFIYKPQSKKVFEGESVKLECQISAIPPPKLFWKRNNEMVQFNTDRIRWEEIFLTDVCIAWMNLVILFTHIKNHPIMALGCLFLKIHI